MMPVAAYEPLTWRNAVTVRPRSPERLLSPRRPILRHLHWLHSVWQIDPVDPSMLRSDPAGLGEVHTASFPENLVRRLINLYSKRGELVLDPFAGSGTTSSVALCLERRAVGYELEEKYVRLIEARCKGKTTIFGTSCERMEELANGSVDLCITSPPYLQLRRYSQRKENIGNHANPYPALRKVFGEVLRVLRPGGHFCLNVADVPERGKGVLSTFPYDLLYVCLSLGFKLVNSIVWDKGVTVHQRNVHDGSVRQNHEYVWVLRKP